jgi:hypothetical protein
MGGKTPHIPPHGDVVIHAPADGWTWRSYEHAIREYTRVRGRAPRTVTMHPDTLETLGLQAHDALAETARRSATLKIKTSHEHDRGAIVLLDADRDLD